MNQRSEAPGGPCGVGQSTLLLLIPTLKCFMYQKSETDNWELTVAETLALQFAVQYFTSCCRVLL